jgi:hypothetical protein
MTVAWDGGWIGVQRSTVGRLVVARAGSQWDARQWLRERIDTELLQPQGLRARVEDLLPEEM